MSLPTSTRRRLAVVFMIMTVLLGISACQPAGPLSTSNAHGGSLVLRPIFSLGRASSSGGLEHLYATERPTSGSWLVDYTTGEQDNAQKCPDTTSGGLNNVPGGPIAAPGNQYTTEGLVPDPAGCAQGIAGYLWVDPSGNQPDYLGTGEIDPNWTPPSTREDAVQADGLLGPMGATTSGTTFVLRPLFDLTNAAGQHRYASNPRLDGGFGSGFCLTNCKLLGYGYDPAHMPSQARAWSGYLNSAGDAYYAAGATGATWAHGNGYSTDLGDVIGLRAQNPVLEPVYGLTKGGRHVYTTKVVERFFDALDGWSTDTSQGPNGNSGGGNGLVGYVWNQQVPGTVPILAIHNEVLNSDLYTTDPVYANNLSFFGWNRTGVLGYASPIAGPELHPLAAYIGGTSSTPAWDLYLTTGSYPNSAGVPAGYSPVNPNPIASPGSSNSLAFIFNEPDPTVPYYEVSTPSNGPVGWPSNQPRPTMVLIHGGGWNAGWTSWAGEPIWAAQDAFQQQERQFWNSKGWTTYNVEYHRYIDVSTIGLRSFLNDLRSITQGPVCVTGDSAGGHLSLMAASPGTDLAGDVDGPVVDCALDLAGPTDPAALTVPGLPPWALSPAAGGGSSEVDLAPYAPKTTADAVSVPVLIAGSSGDPMVLFSQFTSSTTTSDTYVENWLSGHPAAPHRITDCGAGGSSTALPSAAYGPELDVYCIGSSNSGLVTRFVHDNVTLGSPGDQAGVTGPVTFSAYRDAEADFATRVLAGWLGAHP